MLPSSPACCGTGPQPSPSPPTRAEADPPGHHDQGSRGGQGSRCQGSRCAAKPASWGIDAHMGRLFGLANQIVLAALAAGLMLLIGYGYLMWSQRRPTRGFGRPYRRGAWKGVPLGALVPPAALTVAAGLFVPLPGSRRPRSCCWTSCSACAPGSPAADFSLTSQPLTLTIVGDTKGGPADGGERRHPGRRVLP
ncbi:PepSY domain-containing protein [Nonomuraea roseoviolacea]|nr:PepSY domain-containing protein [Nonomuraea roseoviolacea]